MIRRLALGLVMAAALLAPAGAAEAAGTTTRVSVASDGSEGNLGSGSPDVSSDGRFVAFVSSASNLVPSDLNKNTDVFVHDLLSGETTRVSVSSTGQEPTCSPFASAPCSLWPSISADGRFVAFETHGGGLFDGNPFATGIFVHDRDTDADGIFDEPDAISTTMMNVDPEGNPTFGESLRPAISADGRLVAFQSSDLNLVPEDTSGMPDIFVRDRVIEVTERVSVSTAGEEANLGSGRPTISADGRYVAFTSAASNLVNNDTNGVVDIFVRDRILATTTRVSVDAAGNEANLGSGDFGVSMSADGRFVAFDSYASNLVPNDTNDHGDIFVRDMLTQTTERVSIATAGNEGNQDSLWPSLNTDGRFLTFSSYASNLVPGDTPYSDVFVRDRLTGITRLASVDNTGGHRDGNSGYSDVSGDGRLVAFGSDAWQLVPNDTNLWPDVFVHDLGDADGDGQWDPFDPCPAIPNEDPTDNDGDSHADACDGPGSGNVDCNGPLNGVTAVDALKVLRWVAGLSVIQNEPCLDIGQPRDLPPPDDRKVGDVDCSGSVNAVDALKILRALAGLSVAKPAGCPPIIGPPT